MVSFSSPPDDEMYLEQCNQRTVKISVEFRQINYAVYVEVQLIFIHNLNFIFLCFWVWYVVYDTVINQKKIQILTEVKIELRHEGGLSVRVDCTVQ